MSDAFTKDDAQKYLGEWFAPWVQDLNIKFESVEAGLVKARMPFDEKLVRVGGVVCGQALMAYADTMMVYAFVSKLGGFKPMTTVNQTTAFMKPVAETDTIAVARALRVGKTMGFGEVLLYMDGKEDPSVQVTSTYAIISQ